MGKANQLRDCPAVGRGITAVECGKNRGVSYNCPAECPYCPWTAGNYDSFLETEKGMDRKTVGFFLDLVGGREGIRRLENGGNLPPGGLDPDGEMAIHAASCREFFFREVRPGRRLFDVWRESGWKGLAKDEPFLAGFRAGLRVALLEVVRVVDNRLVECLDLFGDPGRVLVFCDRSLAANSDPFDRYLAWACRYPFFERLLGVAVPIPRNFTDARAEVMDVVEGLGGPSSGGEGLGDWLGCHFMDVAAAVHRGYEDSTRRRLAGSDFKECLAVYRWRDGAVDLGLEGRVDFDLVGPDNGERAKRGDHLNYVWLRTGESAKWEDRLPKVLRRVPGAPGEPVWGHLLVFPDRVEVTAATGALFAPMREMVGEFFGRQLEFEREFVADRAKEMWGSDVEAGQGVAVSTNYFREQPADLAAVMKQDFDARMRHLMGGEIPALGGLTPREAAQRAESRAVLRDWAKGCLSSMEALRRSNGLDLDLDWMLDELGLQDLKVPGKRAVPAANVSREGFPAGGWWRVLEGSEVSQAMLGAITAKSPGMELYPGAMEFWQGIGKDLLKRKEKAILLGCGHIVVDVLVPEGADPGHVGFGDMSLRVEEVLADLGFHRESPGGDGDGREPFEKLFGVSVQPALLDHFGEVVFLMHEKTFAPKKVDTDSVFLTLVQLEALMRAIRAVAV